MPIGLERVQESYHELLWMRTLQPSLSEERKARSGNTSLSGNEKCVACPDLMKSSVARGGQGWHSHAAVRSSLFARRMMGEGMAEGPVSSVKQLQMCQHTRPATLTSNLTLFDFMNHFTDTETMDVNCGLVLIHVQESCVGII